MREKFQIGLVTRLISKPPVAFTVCIAIIATFVWQGLASFLPTFLVEYRGQSATSAGVAFPAYFVVQAIMQVPVEYMSDQFSRNISIAACMVTGITGLVLLLISFNWWITAGSILFLETGMSYHSAVLAKFTDTLPEEERSVGFGLVRTTYGVIGALGSVIVGLVADLYGWQVSFQSLAILLLAVFLGVVISNFVPYSIELTALVETSRSECSNRIE